jgi:hypothetical protein
MRFFRLAHRGGASHFHRRVSGGLGRWSVPRLQSGGAFRSAVVVHCFTKFGA